MKGSKDSLLCKCLPWPRDGTQVSSVAGRFFTIWATKESPNRTLSYTERQKKRRKKSYDQTRQLIKKQRHCFANTGPSSQSYGFFSSQVWMWELDHKESWVPKYWCFWTLVLEKTLESPWTARRSNQSIFFFFSQPVHPKGNQSWIFIGRTDAETETPILWPPDAKNWLSGKDWRREEKGTTEDEMVGSYHPLNEHEFE